MDKRGEGLLLRVDKPEARHGRRSKLSLCFLVSSLALFVSLFLSYYFRVPQFEAWSLSTRVSSDFVVRFCLWSETVTCDCSRRDFFLNLKDYLQIILFKWI
jgi:heme/copper-type cytochrome/quinol oxidase subunit 3